MARAKRATAADTGFIDTRMRRDRMNNRLIHSTQALNDTLFGLVLAVAAGSAALLASGLSRDAFPPASIAAASATPVQLERVLVSGKRLAARPAVAAAGSADPSS
jgi:hypothetical protein